MKNCGEFEQSQKYKNLKESNSSPIAGRRSKNFQGRGFASDLEKPIECLYSDECHGTENDGHRKQPGKRTEDEETVNYMSDLPCYLQQTGTERNIQEKALNFGVVGWGHLQRWKYAKKIMSGGRSRNSLSSNDILLSSMFESSTQLSMNDCETRSLTQRRKSLSIDFYLNWSNEEGHSKVSNERPAQERVSDDLRNMNERDQPTKRPHLGDELKISKIEDLDMKLALQDQSKLSETVSSNLKDSMALTWAEGQNKFSDGVSQERTEQSCGPNLHLLGADCENGLNMDESLTFYDKRLFRVNHKFSRGSQFQFSDIPESYPFATRPHCSKCPDIKVESPADLKVTENVSCTCHSSPDSSGSPTIQYTDRRWNQSIASLSGLWVESSLTSRKAKAAVAATKVSSPSQHPMVLNTRSKSSSFREVSSVQQVNSSLPGATRSSTSTSSRDEAAPNNRGKSSPLRRILDPLLRSKTSNRQSSVDLLLNVKASNGSLKQPTSESLTSPNRIKPHNARYTSSLNKYFEGGLNPTTWVPPEKNLGHKQHARLQLSYKNSLPIFTFTLKDGYILAAMMRKVFSSGKNEFEWVYTFFSIHEIKKTRGRSNQREKVDWDGYTSNVVGHMKVSCSQYQKLNSNDISNPITAREFVLYGAVLKQAVHDTVDFLPKDELLAIVVKVPKIRASSDDSGLHIDISLMEPDGCLPREKDSSISVENQSDTSIIAILPGGVHSQPIAAGAPPTLITRWRSGGSCDCGGWDVGCTLNVLSNGGQDYNGLSSSQAGPSTNGSQRYDLFIQGGAHENRHFFSLASSKYGMYKVEFNTSISPLQAFSICIAILQGRKPVNLSELCKLLETTSSLEPICSNRK